MEDQGKGGEEERGEVCLEDVWGRLGFGTGKEADALSQFAIPPFSNKLAVLYSPPYIWPFPYGSGLLHDTAPVQYNAIVSSRQFVSSSQAFVRKSCFVSGVSSGHLRGAFAQLNALL